MRLKGNNMLSDDMLKGAARIAAFTGFEPREIYRFHDTGALPTFKVGRHICARKSELEARLRGLQKQSEHISSPDGPKV